MLKFKAKSQNSKLVVIIIIGFLFSYFLVKNIFSSVFLKRKDRVNVVFYSQNSAYFSLSDQDVNYFIKFPPDMEVLVPGGYGGYRLGGLGKLISLEKKPDLFRKTFSAATSTFVDLYFFPRKTEIYYKEGNRSYFPKTFEIFFSRSNAGFVDRFILAFKLFDRNQSNFKVISSLTKSFDREKFNEDFQGSFYKRSNRNKQVTVQILYKKSYSTSLLLSEMIDGEGIRVVDQSQSDEEISECQVIGKSADATGRSLAEFFGCQMKIGETTVSDIIIKLGNLEKDWAVK